MGMEHNFLFCFKLVMEQRKKKQSKIIINLQIKIVHRHIVQFHYRIFVYHVVANNKQLYQLDHQFQVLLLLLLEIKPPEIMVQIIIQVVQLLL